MNHKSEALVPFSSSFFGVNEKEEKWHRSCQPCKSPNNNGNVYTIVEYTVEHS